MFRRDTTLPSWGRAALALVVLTLGLHIAAALVTPCGDRPGKVIILLGVEREDFEEIGCASIEELARVRNRWAVPGEDDVPVVICRQPLVTLQEVWARQGPGWG